MRDFVKKAFSDFASKIGLMSFGLLFLSLAFVSHASAAIVINEIYGAGGNANASFSQDFVELYNNGGTNVDIAGYSLQYLTGNGTGNFAVCTITAADTIIEPGTYFLISASAVGATGANLPAPNANCNSLSINATAGKIALLNTTSALSGATCPAVAPLDTTIVDFVGYGTASTVNCFEGNTGPAIPPTSGNINSTQRIGAGQDTNDNAVDFARTSPPTPTAAPVNPTAALVNVGGRILNAKGRGISGVLITMTDSNGNNHSAYTTDSGNYLFEGVEVGQTVIFNVLAKRYNFTQPTMVVSLSEESTNVNFTGYESRRF
jgi:hypothetical protein